MSTERIAVVFCEEPLVGIILPYSFFTERQLHEAVGLLQNDMVDFVYVVLNHFEQAKKDAADEYLRGWISQFDGLVQGSFFVSTFSNPYWESFLDHIKYFPKISSFRIFARRGNLAEVENRIATAIAAYRESKITRIRLPVRSEEKQTEKGKVWRNLLEVYHSSE
ncbi:MAG: hypothetical protein ACD_9C00189G0001 [uncultured bacterium]|nr:MAG: hypothetical protein ACD_9C00189G0001 [uncultured bacterium]